VNVKVLKKCEDQRQIKLLSSLAACEQRYFDPPLNTTCSQGLEEFVPWCGQVDKMLFSDPLCMHFKRMKTHAGIDSPLFVSSAEEDSGD